MKQGLFDLWKLGIVNWIEEPLGERVVLTEPEKSVQKPSRLFQNLRVKTTTDGEPDYFNEKPLQIPEFHPRGSAGHREIYAPKAHHKAVIPYAGKGVKHPKESIASLQEGGGRREVYVQKSHHKAGMPYFGKGVKHSQ